MAKTKKDPGGRPMRAGNKESTSIVGFRLTEAERAKYEAAAKAEGFVYEGGERDGEPRLSDWIRAACEARLKR
jgi:hypothetical protein